MCVRSGILETSAVKLTCVYMVFLSLILSEHYRRGVYIHGVRGPRNHVPCLHSAPILYREQTTGTVLKVALSFIILSWYKCPTQCVSLGIHSFLHKHYNSTRGKYKVTSVFTTSITHLAEPLKTVRDWSPASVVTFLIAKNIMLPSPLRFWEERRPVTCTERISYVLRTCN